MTTYTRIVLGIVGDVGIVPDSFPVVSWNLVTAVAGALMFFSGVGKP